MYQSPLKILKYDNDRSTFVFTESESIERCVCLYSCDWLETGIRVWFMISPSCDTTLYYNCDGDMLSTLIFVEYLVFVQTARTHVSCFTVFLFNLSWAPNPFTISPWLRITRSRVTIYYNSDDWSEFIFIE